MKPSKVRAAAAALGALFLMPLEASPARSWSPGEFEVFCGVSGGATISDYAPGENPDKAGPADCLTPKDRSRVEEFAADILRRYSEGGFDNPSPARLGPVVKGGGGKERVRIYFDSNYEGYAQTLSPCLNNGSMNQANLSIITLGTGLLAAQENAVKDRGDKTLNKTLNSGGLLYYVLAHELFHVVMNAQSIADRETYCTAPEWLTEGMTDAAATYLTFQRFPNYRPSLAEPVAYNIYGLRRYSYSFLEEKPKVIAYRTSALWHHLSETYRADMLEMLAGALQTPLARDGDALVWLDDRIREISGDRRLSYVMSEFFTDYSSWGRRKHRGGVGDARWLGSVFDGCEAISLSPRQPVRSLRIEVAQLGAACLRVVTGGLGAGQIASVKIMARDADEIALDNLQLGLVWASGRVHIDGMDRTGYDCYDELRRWGAPLGCIRSPYTGTRTETDGGGFARTWESFGHPVDEAGRTEQHYVLSAVPLVPIQKRDMRAEPQTVNLTLALDVTSVTVQGETSADSAIGTVSPVRAVKLVQDAGRSRIPMTGEGADSAQPFDLTGVMDRLILDHKEMTAVHPDHLDSIFLSLGNVVPDEEDGDLFRGWEFDERMILMLTFDDEYPGGAPRFGATGSFLALLTGLDAAASGGLSMGSGISPGSLGQGLCNYPDIREPSVRVEILTFDADVIRMNVKGTLGRGKKTERGIECVDPKPFSAEMIVPFGWVYDGDGFQSTVTPGIEADREMRFGFLRGAGLPIAPAPERPGSEESSPGGGGSSSTVLSVAPKCDCSCESLGGVVAKMETMGEPDPANMDPEMMSMMVCIDTCGMDRLMQCMMSQR